MRHRSCDSLVIESVSARVCDPRRASVGVMYYETKKVKSVPQNAPVAPRWLHLQVGELRCESAVAGPPETPPSSSATGVGRRVNQGNVVSTERFIGSWRLQVLWLEHGLEPGADRGAWLAYS